MTAFLRTALAALVVTLALGAGVAQAYVGPGAGIGLIGSVIGLLLAVGTALGILLLWPLRRLWRRRAAEAPTERPLEQELPEK